MWDDLSRIFLDRFFLVLRAAELRRDIVGIRQMESESLYDYWERYKKLCASCPQHGLTEQSLLQYFYGGLLPMEMKMIDAASGGALVNMTPRRARELISTMAANSQQYRPNLEPTRRVNGVNVSSLEDKLDKLTNIVQSMLTEKKNPTQLCGICTTSEHPTDLCPILNENSTAHVDDVGGFPRPPQRRYDPFSNTYNPGWKDHPNLNYGASPPYNLSYQPRPLQPPQLPPKPSTSLKAIVERLVVDAVKYQQRTDASIQELTNQVSKLSMAINHLESQGKLPSQRESNPRQNVSAITLCSVKILETVLDKSHGQDKEREKQISYPKVRPESEIQKPFVMPPHFPESLAKDKKAKEEKEIIETLREAEDQNKTTFTCPSGMFAYRRMSFGLCNASATFHKCMVRKFSDYVEKIIEVFMNDFTVYRFYRRFIKNFSKIMQPPCSLLQKDKEFE
ncbi:uncharacterized protein [Gossypium hirsutum]|uniref:Retrotransposon gag domain-containing protein n=1 Tax=Gossypium hirsutum TaxID=3635 RepID=A0A1U8PN47_GOSHI|nr:uncharacterized protein LOC107960875 [Gossypium hirsutum]